jgi:hypothetical protein
VGLELAGEAVSELAEKLLELPDEQPAAVSPAAKTQTVTVMDVRNRMRFLRALGP